MDHSHRLLLYHTLTPLHVGCGQDVGVVDLPVIRERVTGYPYLPGSGTRGALREAFPKERRNQFFGPEVADGEKLRFAGCVSVHDAKILLFPVRSDRKVFLWLTCPAVLQRFGRDLEVFTPEHEGLLPGEDLLSLELDEESFLGASELARPGETLHLEEFAHRMGDGEEMESARGSLARWAAAVSAALDMADLSSRMVLVADPVFHHFARFATVVQQHNRLSSAKTVQRGALFSVEAVPPEAVFYGFLGASPSRWPEEEEAEEEEFPAAMKAEEVLTEVIEGVATAEGKGQRSVLHLGGDESTGLGVTRLMWPASEESRDG